MRLFDYAATIRIKICRKLSECNNLPTDKASPRIKVYQNTFGTKLVYAYLEVRNQNYVQEYFCGLHLSSVVPWSKKDIQLYHSIFRNIASSETLKTADLACLELEHASTDLVLVWRDLIHRMCWLTSFIIWTFEEIWTHLSSIDDVRDGNSGAGIRGFLPVFEVVLITVPERAGDGLHTHK